VSESIELLSPPTNYAVVHLPGRKFPGVVFQGDSLHNLLHSITELRRLTEKYSDDEVETSLAELAETLGDVVQFYEKVCSDRGIALPYPKQ
jgi:hypothetical protein